MNREGERAYRFGEYEARLEGEILLRNGVSLQIQKLPFRMLIVLLENPGRVVSREALRSRLWGDQTHLQFENGLRVVAAKLRDTLGEEAASPTYIKTIARSGYQFIGDVTTVESAASTIPGLPSAAENPSGFAGSGSSAVRKTGLTIGLVAGTLAVIALAIVALYRHKSNRPLDAGQRKILIGSVANDTGDPQLDSIFNLPLQLKLRESHYLNLVSKEASLRGGVVNSRPGVSDTLAFCRSLAAAFLIEGSVTNHAGYRLTLRALDCNSGKVLLTQSEDAPTPLSLLSVLDRSTAKLRQQLGEPAEMVQQSDAPITQATTNSLAALRAFTMGDAKQSPDTAEEAISYYKLAIDLDPQFALAYGRLGKLYSWRGYDLLSRKAYQSAFEFRNRTTDRERLFITAHYYREVTAELPRAIQTYKLWAGMFPYDPEPKNNLAVIYSNETSQPEEASQEAAAALALDPESAAYSVAFANARLGMRDFAYMNRQCQNPQFPASKSPSFRELCYLSFFAQRDEAAMQRETAGQQQSVATELIVDQAAWGAASKGAVSESFRLFQQARDIAARNQRPDDAADILGEQAIVEAVFGLGSQARRDASTAASGDPLSAKAKGLAAFALAIAGDRAGAQGMMKAASTQSPLDSVLDLSMLRSTQAVLALKSHDGAMAVDFLEQSRPYDFSVVMNLAPAYYRGLAYEDLRNWKAAAAEFKSVIDHQMNMPVSLFVVLAKLEFGHALAESGDFAMAAVIFAELDSQWMHADKDFPPLLHLKTYERIRSNRTPLR